MTAARRARASCEEVFAVSFMVVEFICRSIRGLSRPDRRPATGHRAARCRSSCGAPCGRQCRARSEEHTSELQSHLKLVCRLLLEKKKSIYHVSAHKQRETRRAVKHSPCVARQHVPH